MSDIQDIRPEDSVSLANLDITSHTYRSLLSDNLHDPWSRSVTRSNAITTNGYLHAFPSRHSSQWSRTHNNHHSQRRGRPSVRQSEELKDVYKKIKIFFTLICVMVSAMAASVLVVNLKISVFASGEDDDRIVAHYVSGQGKYEAFSLCAKCSMLKDDQIIKETRSSRNREFCCFRTIGKLIDVFDSFVHQHSNHLLSEDLASNGQTLNGRRLSKQFFGTRNMAHCNLDTGNAKSEPPALPWSCEVKVGFEMVDGKLKVSVSSYYYIYSHLFLDPQTDHKVIRSRDGEDDRVLLIAPMFRQDQNSLLEGVVLLMEGDTISVVSTESRIKKASTNDFGMFMV